MSTHVRIGAKARTCAIAAVSAVLVAGCSSAGSAQSGSHADHNMSSMSSGSMPDRAPMFTGDGLSAQASGFTFAPAHTTLTAGQPATFTFTIVGTDGKAVTSFAPDQTKLMHLYLVSDDLSRFEHLHPQMAPDGTWSVDLGSVQPGKYRAYASFITKDGSGTPVPLVLSSELTAPGASTTTPLPAPSGMATVDGYTLTLSGDPIVAGQEAMLSVTVTKDGKDVTDLQPYLETYAHLTAFHQGDLAFAHLHPHDSVGGDGGGPTLSFMAALPKPGNWRMFVQFQTGGVLHTAALTVPVT